MYDETPLGVFIATDPRGEHHEIAHVRIDVLGDTLAVERPGILRSEEVFRCSDGRKLRRISKGKYQLKEPLGETWTSDDPAAP